MKRTLQIANIIALIVTVIINYLSNTGIFNNATMASVSDQYHNLFTPAGYAFSIWLFIYIGLGAFVWHQSRGLLHKGETPVVVGQIGWSFVVSCAANSLWVIAWLYDYTGTSVVIMVVLLLSLLYIMYQTRMELDLITFKKISFESWPFAIYLGWITVALIADVAAYLTKIKWEGFGIPEANWTIIMIGVAAVINILMIWIRNLRESAVVGVWALIAVAVANWDDARTVAYAAISAAILVFINISVHGYQNRKRRFIMEKPVYKRV
ncbi:tryptophan-rich sensory protein [Dyadobacter luticola]|uniref:Tryptophan-rich sensory protein n=1 Tax=Dyadobacter luticola TaxID=1979387 RepID=A0A5R9L1M4_9BACT|nr:tryptophan-rich sensory protein [Dyadobacter luticola]TLV02180.1 tryptophan-rich sensory protein [Dyadobacter luticola]